MAVAAAALAACSGPPDDVIGLYRLDHLGAWETLQINDDHTYVHTWEGGSSTSTWVSKGPGHDGCPGTLVNLNRYIERVDYGFGLDGRESQFSACLVRNSAGEVYITIGDPDSMIAYWRQ